MAAKTFRANSIKEAIGQVKAALGAEAMILSTRRIAKGPQNPYGKDFFEVRAAAGADGTDDVVDRFAAGGGGAVSWENGDAGQWPDMRAALLEIKDMLRVAGQAGGISELLGLHPVCLNLYARLIGAGLSEGRARSFLANGGAFNEGKQVDPEVLTRRVVKAMRQAVRVAAPFSEPSGGPCVGAFVGPTGVGKTTTIAKLCAELSLKQKKKVGIISVDSYRIGAVEQLKTYAAIMGLPCLPAFTREDLSQALEKMVGRDVILIDTAGQSHRDMKRLEELGRLVGGGLPVSTHLVLSTAMKPDDMREAADSFSILHPESYVFTKVDETATRGGILDQILDVRLPISYITNGQRVPEDIVAATPGQVLKLMLS